MTDRGESEGFSSDDLLAEAKTEFGLEDGSSGVAESTLASSVDSDDFSMTAEEIAAALETPEPPTIAPDRDVADIDPEVSPEPAPDPFAKADRRPPAVDEPVLAPEPPAEPEGEGGGFLSALWRNRWIVVVAIVGVSVIAGLLDNSEAVSDLGAGDCFNDPGIDVEVSEVDVLDCDGDHDFEVFGTVPLFGTEFPGDFAIGEQAFDACLDFFEGYVGQPYETSVLYLIPFTPTEGSWESGDREALCIVYEPVPGTDGLEVARRTGSVQGSGL